MQPPKTTTAALALSLLAELTTAVTVGIGRNLDYQVMWVSGQSACTAAKMSLNSEIPCDRPTKLQNGQTYIWKGCGGPTYLLKGDGTFVSSCKYSPKAKEDCGIERVWEC